MSSKARLGWALASSSLLLMIGCAVGSASDDVELAEGELATTPIEAGTDEKDSVKLPPPSTAPVDAGASDAAPQPDAATPDAGPPPDAGPTTVPCAAPAACGSATDMGAVSGDTSGNALTADGTTSKWFRVYVTEDDDGIAGKSLKMTATLTSPPGANFDLYLYTGSSSAHECSAVSAQSTNASGMDAANVSFGESGVLANGSNDSRYVTVEVRSVSGTCSPTAKWQLSVNGN